MRSSVARAGLAALLIAAGPSAAVEISIGLIRVARDAPQPISRLDLPPEDEGAAGARLGLEDNATTGGFLGHGYALVEAETDAAGAVAALEAMLARDVRMVLAVADAESQLALADRAAEAGAVILNVSARDDRLRGADCRANLLHVAASRRMLADGLAQYLVWKRWDRWLLISGEHPADTAQAEAYRLAARKFGAEIEEALLFEDTGGARRSDSGHVQVQRQIPVFLQDAEDHDVIVVADESELFGVYLPYRTWAPRPVTGDAGLRPTIWHPAHEGYGATQLQRRFEALAGRRMTEIDFAAWAAIRAVGEAVTRAGTADPEALTAYMLGPQFELAAFKGLPLSFRPWSRQLRQAVLLADGRNVVSLSPQEGFLHQRNRLDTLGVDAPETDCDL